MAGGARRDLRLAQRVPKLRAIADDLVETIDVRALPERPTIAGSGAFLEWAGPVLRTALLDLARRCGAATRRQVVRGGVSVPYRGGFLDLTLDGEQVELWLFATPARSTYAAPGEPDAVYPHTDPLQPGHRGAADGMRLVEEPAGFGWRGAWTPADAVRAAGDAAAQARLAGDWAFAVLRDCGLVRGGGAPASRPSPGAPPDR